MLSKFHGLFESDISIFSLFQIGSYLDSCVFLGANSSYSACEEDNVFLEGENASLTHQSSGGSHTTPASKNAVTVTPAELVFELQVPY